MMTSNLPAVFYRLLNDEDHQLLVNENRGVKRVVFHQPEKRARS